MKHQIFVIHGGDTFDTYEEYLKFLKDWEIDFEEYRSGKSGWKKTLGERLGKDFEVIMPNMPNSLNAKYAEWKIWFDKFIPHFEAAVVLVGHSLGGVFLAKYLAENILKSKILGVFLVAAPFDAKDSDYTMADFILPESMDKLEEQAGKIFIYHSKDDPVVPFADAGKYKEKINDAVLKTFDDRGHFLQEELPGLIDDIKSLF